jgi:RNA polymerase sigma factor (sigma-70 family)
MGLYKHSDTIDVNQKRSYDNSESTSFVSDLEIWRLFKSGNESAFIQIYESTYKSLFNYGLYFVSNREVVKDCIQDIFIEIREKRNTISETDSIKPFLFKILRRKLHRFIVKHARLKEIDLTPSHESFQITLSYEHYLIEGQISETQIKMLKDAISKLTVKEKEAIYHFYFENHTYKQIADIMGYTDVKTARTLVYKAISSLKSILAPASSKLFFLFL